jgi:hypothetical protein
VHHADTHLEARSFVLETSTVEAQCQCMSLMSACSEHTSRAHSVADFASMLSSAQAQTLTQALLAAHPDISSAGSC